MSVTVSQCESQPDKVSQVIDAGAQTALTSASVATLVTAGGIAFAGLLGMALSKFTKFSATTGFAIGAAAGTLGTIVREALHYRRDHQLQAQGIDSADRLAYKEAIRGNADVKEAVELLANGKVTLGQEPHSAGCGCASCGKAELNPTAKGGHADKLVSALADMGSQTICR